MKCVGLISSCRFPFLFFFVFVVCLLVFLQRFSLPAFLFVGHVMLSNCLVLSIVSISGVVCECLLVLLPLDSDAAVARHVLLVPVLLWGFVLSPSCVLSSVLPRRWSRANWNHLPNFWWIWTASVLNRPNKTPCLNSAFCSFILSYLVTCSCLRHPGLLLLFHKLPFILNFSNSFFIRSVTSFCSTVPNVISKLLILFPIAFFVYPIYKPFKM